jgi:hypothetical protein
MTKNTFFYEDGHDNVYNKDEERVFDPMEGALTEISDPNIVERSIFYCKLLHGVSSL